MKNFTTSVNRGYLRICINVIVANNYELLVYHMLCYPINNNFSIDIDVKSKWCLTRDLTRDYLLERNGARKRDLFRHEWYCLAAPRNQNRLAHGQIRDDVGRVRNVGNILLEQTMSNTYLDNPSERPWKPRDCRHFPQILLVMAMIMFLWLCLQLHQTIAQLDQKYVEAKRCDAGQNIVGYEKGQRTQKSGNNPRNGPYNMTADYQTRPMNATTVGGDNFLDNHKRASDQPSQDPEELKGRPTLHGNEQPVQSKVFPFAMCRSIHLQVGVVLGSKSLDQVPKANRYTIFLDVEWYVGHLHIHTHRRIDAFSLSIFPSLENETTIRSVLSSFVFWLIHKYKYLW